MKKFLFLPFFLLTFSSSVALADFGEGMSAYQRGDYAGAFAAWLPLAEKGDVRSQNNIGILYRRGMGVLKSETKAFEWYERAAIQGLPKSQYNLSLLYKRGRGVKRDGKLALKWLEQAAMNGYPRALLDLGKRYEKGVGVKKDPVKALMWISLSVKKARGKTLHHAAKARERLIGKLNERQISEARRMQSLVKLGS